MLNKFLAALLVIMIWVLSPIIIAITLIVVTLLLLTSGSQIFYQFFLDKLNERTGR